MATTIVRTCDVCTNEGKTAHGSQVFAVVGAAMNTPVLSIDLCDPCKGKLTSKLVSALEAHGYRPDKAPAPLGRTGRPAADAETVAARGISCLWCTDDVVRPFATTSALNTHLHNNHGMPEGVNVADLFGERCPLCGDVAIGSTKGVGSHVRAHPQVGNGPGALVRLFTVARTEGDPHGVVADVVEANRASWATPIKGGSRRRGAASKSA